LSERAYRIIDEVYKEVLPYIEEEVSKELVDFPTFRAVKAIMIGPRSASGYTDVEKKTITISAGDIDRVFEMGYSEPFVKHVVTSALFHELRHYKDLMRMTPAEREEFKRRYVEDPEFHAEFERRATDYGLKWAREIDEIRLRRELEKLTEELREALRGESAPTHSSPVDLSVNPKLPEAKRVEHAEAPERKPPPRIAKPGGEEDLERRVRELFEIEGEGGEEAKEEHTSDEVISEEEAEEILEDYEEMREALKGG